MTFAPVKIQVLLYEVMKMLQLQADMKGLRLVLETDELIKRTRRYSALSAKSDESADRLGQDFYSDSNRITQIVLNLVGNALKFTERGEITIQAQRLGDGDIMISVSDTGIGIKEEDMERLFKEFGKLELGLKQQHLNSQGIGLGLIISNNIAKNLNRLGEGLHIQSSQDPTNHGTTFSFILSDMREEEKSPYNNKRRRLLLEESCDAQLDSPQPAPNRPIFSIQKGSYNSSKFSRIADSKMKNIPTLDSISQKMMGQINLVQPETHSQRFTSMFLQRELQQNQARLSNSQIDAKKLIDTITIEEREDEEVSPAMRGNYIDSKLRKSQEIGYWVEHEDKLIEDHISGLYSLITAQKQCQCSDILIVDDNIFSAYCMQKRLSTFGYISDIAASGKAAQQRITEKNSANCCISYKLIFVDYNLGDCTGVELAQKIQSIIYESLAERWPRLIACTGDNDNQIIAACQNAGMQYFLHKPVNKEELLQLIYKIEIK